MKGKMPKKEISGITLIALVVTIIILIILATVSINVVFGEGGLIKRAEISRQLYENSAKNEEEKMKELENTITDTTSKWKYDQKTQTVTNGHITLNVGEYINYDCHLEKEEIYESKAEINGYSNQTFSSNDYLYGWRVMGASQEGNLLIISEDFIMPREEKLKNTNYNRSYFYLKGKSGYENGINELNKISTLYGKGKNAIGARVVSINDINSITGYDPDKANYGNDSILYSYKNNITYTLKSGVILYSASKYPKNENVTSTYTKFEYYDGTKWRSLAENEKVSIESNYYKYYLNTLTENENEENPKGLNINSNAYKLLALNSKEGAYPEGGDSFDGFYYWLGDSAIGTNDGRANYGIRHMNSNGIGTDFLCNSCDGEYPYNSGIRTVVTLKSGVKLTDSQKTKNGCKIWNM